MERIVEPSKAEGAVKAPSSKSMTQRAIAASVLARGQSAILNPSYCDDSLAAMSIAVGLGAKVDPHPEELMVYGTGVLKESKLNCGESGLAVRMFSPIASLFPAEITLSGSKSLKNRPMHMIGEALTQLGVKYSSSNGFMPLSITGPLNGGNIEIDGSVSSQLLTGLLLALPLAASDSLIRVKNLKSKPYIDMTIQLASAFGIEIKNDNYELFSIKGGQQYQPVTYTVEGDWSGAAFLLVAGAIAGNVTVSGLDTSSKQSDLSVLKALREAGALITESHDSVTSVRSDLRAFTFDATEAPDLFPPLVALASYCKGTSSIKGVSRLKYKESDRATALAAEFRKMGVDIVISDDAMHITGAIPSAARIESHDDHRIAMAAAVAALQANGRISIHDSHCIAKSYPSFFDDLRSLGVKVYE